MKFKLSICSICTLLALLAASCTREPLPEPVEQEGGVVIIEASIPPETRVLYTDSNTPGEGGTLSWQTSDTLLLAGYDGPTYIGSSKFGYTGTGTKFSGMVVPGATTYKAYYPGNIITLDANGEAQLPANFWQQTQSGDNQTSHLSKKLLMRDIEANSLGESFSLTHQSSIIRLNLNNIPSGVGTIQKVIWSLQTSAGGLTEFAILNVTDVSSGTSGLTAFLAFDPTVMKIVANGKVKVTLIGSQASREWSTNTTKVGGMIYEAGKRYYATINGGWVNAKANFSFTIQTTQANQVYEIWQKDNSSTSPANLTINWGDGTNTTIAKDASLAKTIASRKYVTPSTYTITISSDEVDPTVKQMPQIIFYKIITGGDKQVTAILDPFPNMGAVDFKNSFLRCSGLTQIPADLFKHNTQATDFTNCFAECSGLNEIPADLFKYNTQTTDFTSCFYLCSNLTEIPADLFKYNTQAIKFASCFSGCTGLTSIPAGLFNNNTQATNFNSCFYQCSGLTTLPADLFRYNTKATEFNFCFYECTQLTSIPADLFRFNTKATSFYSCFNLCSGLTTLPADLFRYNTEATTFYGCFYGCTKLQLRADIFPDPKTNPGFFEGRTMNFKECFRNVGSYYPTPTGTAPKLWWFTGGGEGTTWTINDCFTGANVVNRNVIPRSWGGDAGNGKVTDVDGEYW